MSCHSDSGCRLPTRSEASLYLYLDRDQHWISRSAPPIRRATPHIRPQGIAIPPFQEISRLIIELNCTGYPGKF